MTDGAVPAARSGLAGDPDKKGPLLRGPLSNTGREEEDPSRVVGLNLRRYQ